VRREPREKTILLTRRAFLQLGAVAAGTNIVVPLISTAHQDNPTSFRARSSSVSYDTQGSYQFEVSDVEYWREGEESLLVRVYQPAGAGPFPAIIFLHGGQWTVGSRLGGGEMIEQLASSGLVVFSPDFRNASASTPYPAAMQDVNLVTRWVRTHASEFNVNPDRLGGMGASSGGHLVTLSAMRPNDPMFRSLPISGSVDATFDYLVLVSPILDPYGRFMFAQETGRDDIVESTRTFFTPWQTIWDANPTAILERGESVLMPPALIIQGTADDNVTPFLQERFTQSYRAAGARAQLEIFQDQTHIFPIRPGADTDRAIAIMKDFIGDQLAAR